MLVYVTARMSRNLTSEQTECCIAAAIFPPRVHVQQLPWQHEAVFALAHSAEERSEVSSGSLPLRGTGIHP